jgi:hypothetical protein
LFIANYKLDMLAEEVVDRAARVMLLRREGQGLLFFVSVGSSDPTAGCGACSRPRNRS